MRYKIIIFIWFGHALISESCATRQRIQIIDECQNLTLKPDEYKLDHNIVFTKYSNDTFSNFWQQNGNMTVCYPFSTEFIACWAQQYTWQLLSTEYSRVNNTSLLRDSVHNIYYSPGNYQFRPGDHLRVCIPINDRPPLENLVWADNYFCVIGSILSAVSMLVCFIIHVTIRFPATDLKPILNHMASLFIAYVFIASRSLISKTDNVFVCYLTAFGKQFGMIAAMCWMNVVAFDLWWRFRPNKLLQLPKPAARDWRRTIRQYCYGWGIPVLILIVSVASEICKTPLLYPNLLESCSIRSAMAQVFLYYGPISLSLSINIVLFIMTLISLCRARQYIAFATGKSQSQILSMSAKLIIVMGIPWIFDVIMWFSNTRPEYWILPEFVMACQGFVLAIVYLRRQHVRDELKKRCIIFITDNCCFWIAKQVAISPHSANIPMNSRDSSSISVI